MSGRVDCLSVGLLVADHLSSPIARLPAAGELVLAERLPLAVGGCAANAAIDLARLGVGVGVVGCVGRDVMGRFVLETLAGHGVDVSLVRQLDSHATSGTLIVNVVGEDRRFIHTVGANAALAVEHLDFEQIRAAKVLYVGGYLLTPALDPASLGSLFRRAREAGVKTVLDVVHPGQGDQWPLLRPVLPHTDVFLPNTDEARLITGQVDPVRQAQAFRAAGAALVAITCGGDGAVLVGEGFGFRSGVYPTQFIGGTGAGDAFDAGYIQGLILGESPRQCLQRASALGASCVRGVGATESVFRGDELEAFLQANRLPIERL